MSSWEARPSKRWGHRPHSPALHNEQYSLLSGVVRGQLLDMTPSQLQKKQLRFTSSRLLQQQHERVCLEGAPSRDHQSSLHGSLHRGCLLWRNPSEPGTRSFRAEVAACGDLEQAFLTSLKPLYANPEAWHVLGDSALTLWFRGLCFRLLSRAGAAVTQLVIHPQKQHPCRLFWLLRWPELSPQLASESSCLKDERSMAKQVFQPGRSRVSVRSQTPRCIATCWHSGCGSKASLHQAKGHSTFLSLSPSLPLSLCPLPSVHVNSLVFQSFSFCCLSVSVCVFASPWLCASYAVWQTIWGLARVALPSFHTTCGPSNVCTPFSPCPFHQHMIPWLQDMK